MFETQSSINIHASSPGNDLFYKKGGDKSLHINFCTESRDLLCSGMRSGHLVLLKV